MNLPRFFWVLAATVIVAISGVVTDKVTFTDGTSQTTAASGTGGGGSGFSDYNMLAATNWLAKGATDTCIPRMALATNTSDGVFWNYATNAEGHSITILSNGWYSGAGQMMSAESGQLSCGFSMNAEAADRQAEINTVLYPVNLCSSRHVALSGQFDYNEATLPPTYMTNGAVVRFHSSNITPATPGLCWFKFWRVGQQATAASGGITPATNEVLILNTWAAYGSTATATIRFGTTYSNTLAATTATYATNAANGSTITILRNGNYTINGNGQTPAGSLMAFALSVGADGTESATTIGSTADGKCLAYASVTPPAGENASCHAGYTGYFPSGSVIRAHMYGTPGAPNYVNLRFNPNFFVP